jgi:GNAT superfamily N-acetyltransferase
MDPRAYASAETLKGGLAVTIRAQRLDDRERVERAARELDPESVYLRLFSYRPELSAADIDRIMRFDPEHEVALLATIGEADKETVIGAGRYIVTEPRNAEVAFVVEEDYHGRGIASRLLHHLAVIARDHGIGTFEADVLVRNKPMQAVFSRTGWPCEKRHDGTSTHIMLTLPEKVV